MPRKPLKQAKSNKRNPTRSIVPEPSVKFKSFFDCPLNGSVSTSVSQASILTPLLSTTGLLSNFPAHGTPTMQNGSPSIRQHLRLERMEVTISLVGSQSTTLAAGDLYNNVRLAIYHLGDNYNNSITNYLSGIVTGTNLHNVIRVYVDKCFALSSTAFDTLNNDNVPATKFVMLRKSLNTHLYPFSYNAAFTNWDTIMSNLVFNIVSDSSVTPNPTFSINVRVWFEFL